MKERIINKILDRDVRTLEYAAMINPREEPGEVAYKIWEKRLRVVIVLVAVAVLLFVWCLTDDGDEGLLHSGNMITRPKETSQIKLYVSDHSNTWEEELDLDVQSREFTKEEIEKIDKKVESYAGDKLLSDNTSSEHIQSGINMVSSIPDLGVSLKWSKDDKYIDDSGKLIRDNIPSGGTDTDVMLEAKWKNYKQVYHFGLHLDEPVYTDTELEVKDAVESITQALSDDTESASVALPAQYSYREDTGAKSYMPVWLVVLVLICLPLVWQETNKNKLTKRQSQLILDHPGFINKVMLLLGAGLSFRKVVERLSDEYEKERADGADMHYVYEELCICMQEMKDGVSEVQAIESFGRRLSCMPYMRFASTITQNIKKGADGILILLEKEAADSLIERKQTALRLGEVAGTKLLFPMMVMLGLVMGIIMVPAFMTF